MHVFILRLRDLQCAADQFRGKHMIYLLLFGSLTSVNTKEPVRQILYFIIKKTCATE